MADLIINSSIILVNQILTFTNRGLNFHATVTGDLEKVRTRLTAMQEIVQRRGASSLEADVNTLRQVDFDIEDALDLIMLHTPRHSPTYTLIRKIYELGHYIRNWAHLHEIHAEIKKTMECLDEMCQRQHLPGDALQRKEMHHISQTFEDDKIMGIEVLKQKLLSQMINSGERSCIAVVVVGPPGSGKTVVANSVFSKRQVTRHFSCKVSARLSHSSDVSSVLTLLASKTSQYRDRKISDTKDDATDLTNNLRGKRYLVFLDDVWSEEDWKAIKHALPDDSNGSRVIITTTKHDVATSISEHVILVEGLEQEDSWQLFCEKAFSEEQQVCPPDLMELSRKIMNKCEGLPLAISAVGNMLAKKSRLPADWIRVHDNLRDEMESDSKFSDLNNSMLQSYENLHANLKSCLLYFSLFPEGRYISCARLLRLWVAERLVNVSQGKPAEQVAQEYLDELISRHLVVADKYFGQRVKKCRVTYFLHYFLTIKSKKENFAVLLDKASRTPEKNVRRLSIADTFSVGGKVKGLNLKRVCTSFMSGDVSLPQITYVWDSFKYLKVLEIHGERLQEFPKCVTDLELLRYLSFRFPSSETSLSSSSSNFKVPSSIKKLRYLEVLDLKNTSVTSLPKEICLLRHLQHCLVYQVSESVYVTFDSVRGTSMNGEIGSLSSLRILTLLKAENRQKFFDELGNLTQLQRLGLIELRKSYGKSLCESLAKMEHLSVLDLRSANSEECLDLDYTKFPSNKLHRLYLSGPLEKLPSWIKDLKSLVRLKLKWSKLLTNPLNELQVLNNLTELHLVDAFTEKKIEFRSGTFLKLKVLLLEDLAELSTVRFSEGSLCNLQSLTLRNCGQLNSRPSGIKSLSELKEILLFDMPAELINSLSAIKEILLYDTTAVVINSLRGSALDFLLPNRNGLLRSKIKVYSSDATKMKWIEQDFS